MTRRAKSRMLFVLAGVCASAVAVATADAGAQAVIFQECQADRAWTVSPDTLAHPWSLLHPVATYERGKAELAGSGRWELAAREVTTSFHLLAGHAALSPERRALMEAQLDAMRRDLVARGDTGTGLDNAGRFDSHLTPAAAEFSFGTPSPVLRVTADEPVATIRAICWTAIAAQELLSFANRNARTAVLGGLDRAVAAWDAFNATGYAQYPWELLLNRPQDDLMPPRWQVVLMHPGIGLEVVGVRDLDSARRADTILLEPLGLLRYTDTRRFYLGASLLASLPSGESPGLGAMLHVGPFLKLGYVLRRAVDDEPGRDALVITADLLQLVTGAPELYQRARSQAAELLAAAVDDR